MNAYIKSVAVTVKNTVCLTFTGFNFSIMVTIGC